MIVNKKVTGKSRSMAAGLALGTTLSLVVTILGAAIIANLVLSGKMASQAVGYGAIVVLLVSAALGAWISASLIKRRWMVVCIGAGGCYYLLLLAITALFFGGQYQGMGVTALLVLGGCGAIGLLGIRGEKGSRKTVKKYRFR